MHAYRISKEREVANKKGAVSPHTLTGSDVQKVLCSRGALTSQIQLLIFSKVLTALVPYKGAMVVLLLADLELL